MNDDLFTSKVYLLASGACLLRHQEISEEALFYNANHLLREYDIRR